MAARRCIGKESNEINNFLFRHSLPMQLDKHLSDAEAYRKAGKERVTPRSWLYRNDASQEHRGRSKGVRR